MLFVSVWLGFLLVFYLNFIEFKAKQQINDNCLQKIKITKQ